MAEIGAQPTLFDFTSPQLSVKEAAMRLGCCERQVSELLESGELQGYDIAVRGSKKKYWRVLTRSIDLFKQARSNMVIASPAVK